MRRAIETAARTLGRTIACVGGDGTERQASLSFGIDADTTPPPPGAVPIVSHWARHASVEQVVDDQLDALTARTVILVDKG